jgi:proteasome accessory factor B
LPLPFKNSALLGGLKIENTLPAQIREYCNATLQNISIRPHSHAPMDLLDKVFSQLQDAIRKNHKVRLDYHSLFDGKDIVTTLSPYHLMYNHRAWYVIGKSGIHDGSIRMFKLNRIKGLTTLASRFSASEKFDVYDYLGKAWSMIPEGRIYNVKLRFSRKVARNVAEVQWHSTQKMTHNDDGTLTVKFRVDGLGEIGWWILGYGDQVEVLAPAALRKHIARTAKRMAELNR